MCLTFQSVDVSDLPGVGRTNSHKFRSMGIETCEQLQEKSLGFLKQEFGAKFGQSIYNFCRGIDDRQEKNIFHLKKILIK